MTAEAPKKRGRLRKVIEVPAVGEPPQITDVPAVTEKPWPFPDTEGRFITLSREQIEAAFLRWEADFRQGLTLPQAEVDAMVPGEVARRNVEAFLHYAGVVLQSPVEATESGAEIDARRQQHPNVIVEQTKPPVDDDDEL